jgi:hypothetical protein
MDGVSTKHRSNFKRAHSSCRFQPLSFLCTHAQFEGENPIEQVAENTYKSSLDRTLRQKPNDRIQRVYRHMAQQILQKDP